MVVGAVPADVGAHRAEALLIARIALAQPLAEDGLQAGEAVEAEMLGEADQRRRLDAGGDGDAGAVPKAISSGLSRA